MNFLHKLLSCATATSLLLSSTSPCFAGGSGDESSRRTVRGAGQVAQEQAAPSRRRPRQPEQVAPHAAERPTQVRRTDPAEAQRVATAALGIVANVLRCMGQIRDVRNLKYVNRSLFGQTSVEQRFDVCKYSSIKVDDLPFGSTPWSPIPRAQITTESRLGRLMALLDKGLVEHEVMTEFREANFLDDDDAQDSVEGNVTFAQFKGRLFECMTLRSPYIQLAVHRISQFMDKDSEPQLRRELIVRMAKFILNHLMTQCGEDNPRVAGDKVNFDEIRSGVSKFIYLLGIGCEISNQFWGKQTDTYHEKFAEDKEFGEGITKTDGAPYAYRSDVAAKVLFQTIVYAMIPSCSTAHLVDCRDRDAGYYPDWKCFSLRMTSDDHKQKRIDRYQDLIFLLMNAQIFGEFLEYPFVNVKPQEVDDGIDTHQEYHFLDLSIRSLAAMLLVKSCFYEGLKPTPELFAFASQILRAARYEDESALESEAYWTRAESIPLTLQLWRTKPIQTRNTFSLFRSDIRAWEFPDEDNLFSEQILVDVLRYIKTTVPDKLDKILQLSNNCINLQPSDKGKRGIHPFVRYFIFRLFANLPLEYLQDYPPGWSFQSADRLKILMDSPPDDQLREQLLNLPVLGSNHMQFLENVKQMMRVRHENDAQD